jgi:DNA polymerase-3 subunit epsilon
MRQIVLDTETTGLDVALGHKIIEVGCIELVDRKFTGRTLHLYLNPEREVEAGAIEVHGITNEMLADKPVFAAIADSFVEFVQGAELIIHNAPFDIGFLNQELASLQRDFRTMQEYCQILDTLALARKKHPGQKNNLDALCKRYQVDNSQRELHGALKDAEILADVYLLMTGGQSSLVLGYETNDQTAANLLEEKITGERLPLRVLKPAEDELAAHTKRLQQIQKSSGDKCLWLKLDAQNISH